MVVMRLMMVYVNIYFIFMLFFVLCEGIVKFYTFILLYIFAFELIFVLCECIVTL
jgi:hypothetical protein